MTEQPTNDAHGAIKINPDDIARALGLQGKTAFYIVGRNMHGRTFLAYEDGTLKPKQFATAEEAKASPSVSLVAHLAMEHQGLILRVAEASDTKVGTWISGNPPVDEHQSECAAGPDYGFYAAHLTHEDWDGATPINTGIAPQDLVDADGKVTGQVQVVSQGDGPTSACALILGEPDGSFSTIVRVAGVSESVRMLLLATDGDKGPGFLKAVFSHDGTADSVESFLEMGIDARIVVVGRDDLPKWLAQPGAGRPVGDLFGERCVRMSIMPPPEAFQSAVKWRDVTVTPEDAAAVARQASEDDASSSDPAAALKRLLGKLLGGGGERPQIEEDSPRDCVLIRNPDILGGAIFALGGIRGGQGTFVYQFSGLSGLKGVLAAPGLATLREHGFDLRYHWFRGTEGVARTATKPEDDPVTAMVTGGHADYCEAFGVPAYSIAALSIIGMLPEGSTLEGPLSPQSGLYAIPVRVDDEAWEGAEELEAAVARLEAAAAEKSAAGGQATMSGGAEAPAEASEPSLEDLVPAGSA